MDQNALGQSDCKIFKTTITLEKMIKKPDFLHVDTDLWKLKVDWNYLCGVVENRFWPFWSQDCRVGWLYLKKE